jgi:hypothetical protein
MNIKPCLGLVCLTLACTNPQKKTSQDETEHHRSKITQAEWLIGSWSNESKNGFSYEVWKKYNDTIFVGRSYSIQGADTVSSEFIKLVQDGDELSYIPTVPDQNMGLPVAFRLIFLDSSKLVFENQEHDFPQTIAYQRISRDSMVAEISGLIKGEYRARQFPMTRSE